MIGDARRVASGPYPLYRLLVFGVLVACILQLFLGVPAVVVGASPVLVDFMFMGFQFGGALSILASFWMRNAYVSLQVERIGAIGLITSSAIYFAALIFMGTAFPATSLTWCSVMFTIYLLRRVVKEIPVEIREVRSVASESVRRGGRV